MASPDKTPLDAATWLNMNRPVRAKRANFPWGDYIDALEDEFREREAAAEAEVVRLRQALREIVDTKGKMLPRAIARQALGEEVLGG